MNTLKYGLMLLSGGAMTLMGWAQDAPPSAMETAPTVDPSAVVEPAAPQEEPTGAVVQEQPASDDSVSFQTFYDQLGEFGTWIQNDDYGYIWQPNVQDPDWAPYTVGHWVYTEDGWTWASDEPWGWATYHYGRWVNLDNVGWCWVPGYTWSPAWVSWRYGEDYSGWAPLPPDSFVGVDYATTDYSLTVGYYIGGDCDALYGIGAGCYRFVPTNCLGNPSYKGCYAKPCDNFAIINRTKNLTNLKINRKGEGGFQEGHGGPGGRQAGNFHHVTAGGPPLAQVNAVSPKPVPQVKLVGATRPGQGTLNDQSLSLYAPRFHAPDARGSSQPSHVAGKVDHMAVNRGVDVTRPMAVNAQLTPPPPTRAEIQRAQLAQYNAPERAKVLTPNTQVKPVLQTPLTSLQPMAPPVSPTRTRGRLNVIPETPQASGTPSLAPRSYPNRNNGDDELTPPAYPPRTKVPSTAPHLVQPNRVPGNDEFEPGMQPPPPTRNPYTVPHSGQSATPPWQRTLPASPQGAAPVARPQPGAPVIHQGTPVLTPTPGPTAPVPHPQPVAPAVYQSAPVATPAPAPVTTPAPRTQAPSPSANGGGNSGNNRGTRQGP